MAEDIGKILDEYKEETKRHFDVVAEDLKGAITQVAEGVSTNADAVQQIVKHLDGIEEQLDQLQGMRVSIESLREDAKRIRFDLTVIEGKISKKPAHEDLVSLDKRIWRLEQKIQSGQ